VMIAVATLVMSASGSLAGRLGEERAFTVTLSVGVVMLFVGFLLPSLGAATPARLRETLSSSSNAQRVAND